MKLFAYFDFSNFERKLPRWSFRSKSTRKKTEKPQVNPPETTEKAAPIAEVEEPPNEEGTVVAEIITPADTDIDSGMNVVKELDETTDDHDEDAQQDG